MKMRSLEVAILVAIMANPLLAQQDDAAKVGDMVVISMTGDLAKEFSKRTSGTPAVAPPNGIRVELAATVDHVFQDGALLIEYSHMMRDEKPMRMVTLRGKIEPQQITTDITPKGTKVYSSPLAEPTVTTEDYKDRRLELLDLKGFKLRIWTLAEELGE